MATSFSELILSAVSKLILDAVKKRAGLGLEELFAERKLRRRVEDAVDRVVEPLLPFMKNEGLGDVQQRLLVEICVEEMRIAVEEPERLFRASLNGQKLFEQLHAGREYPEAIRQERLESVYELVGPQIGSLLCELTNAVDAWKLEKSREDYSRFDEIGKNQRDMIEMMIAAKKAPLQESDSLLLRIRRAQYQRIKMELDLTGLRGEQAVACKLEHMFVHPPLTIPPKYRNQPLDELNNEEESAAYFLCSSRRSVLIGPPGAGKSTWTKWLQMRAFDEHWNGVVIRIELRAYATQDPPSYVDILRTEAGTHLAEELTPERIRPWVASGRIVFIVDGFDELPPTRRDSVLQWILELAEFASVCPIILTSRPLTTDHLKRFTGAWRTWLVGDFDEPRILRYIEAWYRYMPLLPDAERTVDAVALAATWKTDPTLRPLTGNPLLLSTLLVVHHLDGALPRGRAKLYERYIEGMLGVWDDRRKIESMTLSLSPTQKRRLLRRLALEMHLAARDQIEEDDAKAAIGTALHEMQLSLDGALVLDVLRERSGLLIGPGTYGFAHKSIGEFLVAEAIVEGNERDRNAARVDRMMLFRNRHEDRWNAVLFFWAGLAPAKEVEEFARDCMPIDEWRDVLLAVSLVNDQGERLPTAALPAELVQRMVAMSQVNDIDIEKSMSFRCMTTGAATLMIEIRSVELRGLQRTSLDDVFEQWHEAGHFEWMPVRAANGLVRQSFWFACVSDPSSFDEWYQCLRDASTLWPFPVSEVVPRPESQWLVPLHAIARRLAWFKPDVASPKQIMDAIRTVNPNMTRVATFIFILGCIQLSIDSRHPRLQYSTSARCALQRYIDIWGEYISMSAEETWLHETANMRWDGWSTEERLNSDLLHECLVQLHASIESGVLAKTPAVEHVIQTIEQLIVKRAVLLADLQTAASRN